MRKLYPFLAALLLLPGCAKEEAADVASPLPDGSSGIVPLEAKMAPAGEPTTILAGFSDGDETRSRIEQDGNVMKVLWTRGDSFEAMYISGQSAHRVFFSTSDDGVSEAAFSTNYSLNGSSYYCFYPKREKWGYNSDNTLIFGLNLPSSQTAVAGGIEEGLNRAFGYADYLDRSMTECVRFYNLPALVKFNLSGAVVSRVKEVTFTGSGALAGDLVFHRVNGIPETMSSIQFNGDERSSKVVLRGDFEAGVDYFIAVWPCQLPWFRMEFSDVEGNSTLKQSAKALNLERSRVKDFGTIDLGDDFVDIDDGSLEPIRYMTATEGTKPVTIAVIPDGFTKEQLSQYELLAKAGINALFDTEPYKTYKNRFNVYILKAASRESGASITDGNGVVTTPVSTYFSARWGQSTYSDMQADDETVFSFVQEKCPDIVDGIHTIAEVPVIMIINDSRYGGICWSYNNGQGYAMVPYTSDGGGLQWSLPSVVPATDDPLPTPVDSQTMRDYSRDRNQNDLDEVGGYNRGDWRNTLVHEFGGHCFGRLGDEYWSSSKLNYTANAIGGHSWTVPFSMNLTADPYAPTWQVLLNHRDELVEMDPLYSRIGVFQGGDTFTFGRWRSEKISCMIDNRFYYSAWQRYLITQRIFKLSGDEDDFSFEYWLSNDVTTDPVRDVVGSGTPGGYDRNRTYTPVPPLPPPVLVEK